MSPLRKLLRLPAHERRLLLQAWLLLGALRLALWLLPFRTIQSLVARLRTQPRTEQGPHIAMERVGWAVAVASVYMPFATCLPQALVAQMLLRRHGYQAQVRIGVAHTESGRLAAHAWVECAGQIVIGGSADAVARYTVLPSLPLERHHGIR
jgi:hypothetical protein